jgi:hypothetical protein
METLSKASANLQILYTQDEKIFEDLTNFLQELIKICLTFREWFSCSCCLDPLIFNKCALEKYYIQKLEDLKELPVFDKVMSINLLSFDNLSEGKPLPMKKQISDIITAYVPDSSKKIELLYKSLYYYFIRVLDITMPYENPF